MDKSLMEEINEKFAMLSPHRQELARKLIAALIAVLLEEAENENE